MAGVIMAVLGLLAAEDLKYKAVTVWKLVLFGLVCTCLLYTSDAADE